MKVFKSRTLWTILVMFLIGGVNSIHEMIPPVFVTVLEAGLGLLATYYKLSPSQNYER